VNQTKIIVNADDFGESSDVNHGIAKCIESGMLTSTTIMANMPGTREALRWAAARGHQASFGVHLNLCQGPSLTRAPSLTDSQGNFRPKRVQALRAVTGRLVLDEIKAEFDLQICAVRDAGVEISHLDSHKHLHQLPGIATVAAEIAVIHEIERVRCTRENGFWPKGIPIPRKFSRLLRMVLAKNMLLHLEHFQLRTPETVFDLSELMAQDDRQDKIDLLSGRERISEMFCHPGGAISKSQGYRHAEYEFLLSDEFRDLISESGVELISYWEL